MQAEPLEPSQSPYPISFSFHCGAIRKGRFPRNRSAEQLNFLRSKETGEMSTAMPVSQRCMSSTWESFALPRQMLLQWLSQPHHQSFRLTLKSRHQREGNCCWDRNPKLASLLGEAISRLSFWKTEEMLVTLTPASSQLFAASQGSPWAVTQDTVLVFPATSLQHHYIGCLDCIVI